MVLLEDVVGVVLSKVRSGGRGASRTELSVLVANDTVALSSQVNGGVEDGRVMSVLGIMSSVVKSVVPVVEEGEGPLRLIDRRPEGGEGWVNPAGCGEGWVNPAGKVLQVGLYSELYLICLE